VVVVVPPAPIGAIAKKAMLEAAPAATARETVRRVIRQFTTATLATVTPKTTRSKGSEIISALIEARDAGRLRQLRFRVGTWMVSSKSQADGFVVSEDHICGHSSGFPTPAIRAAPPVGGRHVL